jgi:hypothetical protein
LGTALAEPAKDQRRSGQDRPGKGDAQQGEEGENPPQGPHLEDWIRAGRERFLLSGKLAYPGVYNPRKEFHELGSPG